MECGDLTLCKKGGFEGGFEKGGFASLLGLLLTLVIIAFLYYLATNAVGKKSSTETPEDRSTPRSVLDKARNAVSDLNKRQSVGK